MHFADNIINFYILQYSTHMKKTLKYQNKVIKQIFSGLTWLVPTMDCLLIAGIFSLHNKGNVIYQAVIYFAVEILLLFAASIHSPGYCAEMEGEMDIEKTSLLTKDTSNVSKRGAICKECGIKRPLRSCHCPECGRCVVRFDHHDVVVNNCIGYGNQQYYLFFLLFGNILPLQFVFSFFIASGTSSRLFLSLFRLLVWIIAVIKFLYHVTQLKRFIPNVIDNITEYESMNAFRIGYLKDANFRFYNPFNHGLIKNCLEFFHLSTDWMRTFYYCLMDIPDHPLRVKGLEYLQQKSEKNKMKTCTCPKCGIQLDRPKEGSTLQCPCGFVING